MERKLREASFTLEDFLDQLQQVKQLGPLGQVLGMLPGMSQQLKDVEVDDRDAARVEAIRSMTPAIRVNPKILNGSRRARIAKGSGTTTQQVNALLKQFEEARRMMKQLSGMTPAKLRRMACATASVPDATAGTTTGNGRPSPGRAATPRSEHSHTMAVKIRLMRMGAKSAVLPRRRRRLAQPRDGRFLENLGVYHPNNEPSKVEIDTEKAAAWLRPRAPAADRGRGQAAGHRRGRGHGRAQAGRQGAAGHRGHRQGRAKAKAEPKASAATKTRAKK